MSDYLDNEPIEKKDVLDVPLSKPVDTVIIRSSLVTIGDFFPTPVPKNEHNNRT